MTEALLSASAGVAPTEVTEVIREESSMRAINDLELTERPVDTSRFEAVVDVKAAARFLGVSPSLVYAYVERKQIPHFRMMGRSIRFSLSELEKWRQKFFVNGGIDEYYRKAT